MSDGGVVQAEFMCKGGEFGPPYLGWPIMLRSMPQGR